MNAIDVVRNFVRKAIARLAVMLDRATNGRLSPDTVTLVSFLVHPFIALMVAADRFVVAAILLIIFGLFDSLDGALARHQKVASPRGMFLDASSDRLKEAMLYVGASAYFVYHANPRYAVWCVAASGIALSISYVKAKGEAAIASTKHVNHQELNRLFADGVASLEIRMFILVVGLLADRLLGAIVLISVLGSLTLISRITKIYRYLSHV